MEYTDKTNDPGFVNEYNPMSSAAARIDYDDSHNGEKVWTTDDIEALPDGVRKELIHGKIYDMATPTYTHQAIQHTLSYSIENHIRSKKGRCKVVNAPFAVYLRNDEDYFEPDITVVCDLSKLDEKGCHGAPDWVIEIISPSTASKDKILKTEAYYKAGVREYWIVDYDSEELRVYNFENSNTQHADLYALSATVASFVIEGLEIDFADVMERVRAR